LFLSRAVLFKYSLRTKITHNLLYIKPVGPITKDTISRWLKNVMSRSGIDINTCSAHSVRAASTSKANANLVPVDNILKVAGWSNAETFLEDGM
jgi:site-specific recombinase XerD